MLACQSAPTRQDLLVDEKTYGSHISFAFGVVIDHELLFGQLGADQESEGLKPADKQQIHKRTCVCGLVDSASV